MHMRAVSFSFVSVCFFCHYAVIVEWVGDVLLSTTILLPRPLVIIAIVVVAILRATSISGTRTRNAAPPNSSECCNQMAAAEIRCLGVSSGVPPIFGGSQSLSLGVKVADRHGSV